MIMNLEESLLLQIKMFLIKKMTFGFKDGKVKIKQKIKTGRALGYHRLSPVI